MKLFQRFCFPPLLPSLFLQKEKLAKETISRPKSQVDKKPKFTRHIPNIGFCRVSTLIVYAKLSRDSACAGSSPRLVLCSHAPKELLIYVQRLKCRLYFIYRWILHHFAYVVVVFSLSHPKKTSSPNLRPPLYPNMSKPSQNANALLSILSASR